MSSPVIPLNSQNLVFVEQLFSSYLADPASVSAEWKEYFDTIKNGDEGLNADWSPESPFQSRSLFNPPGTKSPQLPHQGPSTRLDEAARQERLDQLIRNYRVRGHILAAVDPLGSTHPSPAELDPAFYGFQEADFDRDVSTSWVGGPATRTLRGIINWLKQTYCRNIGAQFMHIDSLQVRQWLALQMEETGNRIKLKRPEQLRILQRLADAVVFEEFLARKFVGAKSFSLEGAESLIPLLDMAIEKTGNEGVREIVIGMAHRGRLNVLANIMGKSPRAIFREFDDVDPELYIGRGDVKYHMGYSANWETSTGNSVHLSLCFNPSHLEYVNTVAQGRVRAKMDRHEDFKRERGATILIHGDAAFAGEGIVQETLNLSELSGYRTGGTIHIIVNNQIGFTTNPSEGRSTTYATDVAKMLQIPIFHVNGEHPEAVAQVVNLALEFRKKFKRDVVIDMYCYRRRGHNEGDEPSFTQPVMYKEIRKHATVYEGYLNSLLELRGITREDAEKIEKERRERLEKELDEARRDDYIRCVDQWGGIWGAYQGGPESEADRPETGLEKSVSSELLINLNKVPENFKPHPKAQRILDSRIAMANEEEPLDWGGAEALAFASVVAERRPFRLSGQDVRRGTFSHRHAVLFDKENGKAFITYKNILNKKGYINIHNSPLSEAGVLGFEYGYSLDRPDGLTIWEAQFGDFVNAAQVIIDQFIASAEDKWNRLSSLVMFLPHGFEGQGPEHSSARLERFLTMAAEDNFQVCQPTTPAQHFHLLRRQVLRRWKKPLIVMTPKSLLRNKECISTLDDCATGRFQEVLSDPEQLDAAKIKQVLLCSGKVYYDLIEKRRELDVDHSMIVRIEQLYPFPINQIQELLKDFPDETQVCWVQEEPSNMGAWSFLKTRFGDKFLNRFPFDRISRPASASPATGSSKTHKFEQEQLLNAALNLEQMKSSGK